MVQVILLLFLKHDLYYLQSTLDDVAGLRKRHEDFASKLKAQDEKMRALDELADRLIREGHPDAKL